MEDQLLSGHDDQTVVDSLITLIPVQTVSLLVEEEESLAATVPEISEKVETIDTATVPTTTLVATVEEPIVKTQESITYIRSIQSNEQQHTASTSVKPYFTRSSNNTPSHTASTQSFSNIKRTSSKQPLYTSSTSDVKPYTTASKSTTNYTASF
eukprot:gene19138-22920_t